MNATYKTPTVRMAANLVRNLRARGYLVRRVGQVVTIVGADDQARRLTVRYAAVEVKR